MHKKLSVYVEVCESIKVLFDSKSIDEIFDI